MRIKFILIFCLLPFIGRAQEFNAELIKYTGTIFKQVATGEISVFDSLMRKLPPDSLYNKFVSAKPGMADNLSNNFYTKNTFKEAAFINSFHYGLFEGLMGLPDLPGFLFDTLTYKPTPKFIVFRLYRYNDEGSFKDRKKLFLVNRNTQPINKKLIVDKAIRIATDSQNKLKAKMLITGTNENWKLSELLVNNKRSDMDICQSQYRLKLNADMRFSQYYTTVSDFEINKKAGVDTGIERGFYYPPGKQHVQFYLENESGIWCINKDRLIVMTNTGIVLTNYKILALKNNYLQIQVKNYKIKFKKE